MLEKFILITGSCGLIGSESVRLFIQKGYTVVGIDNDMRGFFFGKQASTSWLKKELIRDYPTKYIHIDCDIRDEKKITTIFKTYPFELIIHTAAQPSHDWAATEPVIDFSINALGTVLLLENLRKYTPKAIFIFTSSSKVYGDRTNHLPLHEFKTRYDLFPSHKFYEGVKEDMGIDNSLHSLYGASKAAADLMVQEYGKYYNLRTIILRGNCMTGSKHSGTLQHGFLSYLVKCIKDDKPYTVFGYHGKQVRDNIHAVDFVCAIYHCFKEPRMGEVYNLGGGRCSNISIIEAIEKVEFLTQKKSSIIFRDSERKGDHKWYISNTEKFRKHYPKWELTYTISDIILDLLKSSSNASEQITM